MRLLHAGLVSSSEYRADRFFEGVLGLAKSRRSRLSKELARRLFDLDRGCEIVYYGDGELELEVFITGPQEIGGGRMSHLCFEVASRTELLAKCAELGFAVREVPKRDYVVCFVEDADGNLFEIKEKR